MLCEQAREHLSAYLDRELSSELSSAVRAHLESCADCRTLLADLRATAGLLGALPVHRAPADLADDVRCEVERRAILPAAETAHDAEPQERTLSLQRVRFWPRALAVAASLLLVVGIGVLALLGPGGGPETVPALRSSEHGAEVAKDGEVDGRVGPSDLEHVAKAPGPDSLAEDADRRTRLRVAEKPSSVELAAVLEIQRAMNQAAKGEVPIDELKQVATVENLKRAGDNTLVIETEAPAEVNRDLKQLFGWNGWQPVASPSAKADVSAEGRAGELGKAVDKAGAPARVAARRPLAAAPQGYYFLAHSNGEYTWVVIADRNYISRFGSQLAADERLRVGNESGRQFQAIRTLQDEVRQFNLRQSPVALGKAQEPATGHLAVQPPPAEEPVPAAPEAIDVPEEKAEPPAATQAPAAPASKVLAERERCETNDRFSYDVRLPANQDLLVIRVQRPEVSADGTVREAAEDAAKPTVGSGH